MNHKYYNKLISLVKKEAENLKKYATINELLNLDLNRLDGLDQNYCIYGQLTTNCYSVRASELISLCTKKVYDIRKIDEEYNNWGNLIKNQTIKPFDRFKLFKTQIIGGFFSPIELFINLDNNHNNSKILIEYLQGKINTLEFNKIIPK